MLFHTFHTSGFVPPTRDWPEYESNSPSPLTVFDGGYKNGFFDASWNTMVLPISRNVRGLLGQPALCAVISPNASARPGSFMSMHCFLLRYPLPSVSSLTMALAGSPGLPWSHGIVLWAYLCPLLDVRWHHRRQRSLGTGRQCQPEPPLCSGESSIKHWGRGGRQFCNIHTRSVTLARREMAAVPPRSTASARRSLCPLALTAPTIGEDTIPMVYRHLVNWLMKP